MVLRSLIQKLILGNLQMLPLLEANWNQLTNWWNPSPLEAAGWNTTPSFVLRLVPEQKRS